eukprot:TRINITY_DN70683_c0_g1_i1.p1 TRINITY_DN70683_c0_g1~~TRINITY_DN70683_c0_g1_i1.p1  ORF type:complete len:360 (+),score=49.83 TRINITY_DN70683_c0_g1_i1:78-1157(+)
MAAIVRFASRHFVRCIVSTSAARVHVRRRGSRFGGCADRFATVSVGRGTLLAARRLAATAADTSARSPPRSGHVVITLREDGSPHIDLREGAMPIVEVDQRMTDVVFSTLVSTGYWSTSAAKDRSATAAIAKFFRVNQLGALVVFPFSHIVFHAHTAIEAGLLSGKKWKTDPGNLVYLVPLGSAGSKKTRQLRFGGPDSARLATGGGPSLFQASERIVDDVLERLGYQEPEMAKEADVALRLFCEHNEPRLRRFGGPFGEDVEVSLLRERLSAVFKDQTRLQEWKVPVRDDNVRKFLRTNRLIKAVDAPREDVLFSMRKYLTDVGVKTAGPPPSSYNEAVLRMQRLLPGGAAAGRGGAR